MAISNFKIPTGLDVSGSTVLTGTLDVSGLVNVTTLTASVGVSASVGRFGDLNVASLSAPSLNLAGDLTVSGTVNLGNEASDLVYVNGQLTASAGVEVASGNLKVLNGALSASSTLDVGGAATLANGLTIQGSPLNASAVAVSASALNVTNDISARSASLSGDLTVQGDLTVNGALTYLNTQNLQVSDSKVVIAYGSGTGLDAGIYVASDTSPLAKFYFNGSDAWLSDKSVKVTGDLSASVLVAAPVITGSTVTGTLATFQTVSASVGLSGALGQFTQVTASSIYSSVNVNSPTVTANRFGTSNVAFQVLSGGTGTLDTFTQALYGAAKYIIKAKDTTDNKVHAIEVLVTTDGTLVYHVPYASVFTSASPLISVNSSIGNIPVAGTVAVTITNLGANTVDITVMKLCVG